MVEEKFIALIPAYKPSDVLLTLVRDFISNGFVVVVVNDGSGMEYKHIFEECASCVILLTHDINKGKGGALKTGLRYISEHMPDTSTIVTVDADGQHRVEDALKIAHLASKEKNTLVLGSRKLNHNIPLRSKFGNAITRLKSFLKIQLMPKTC